jgi:xanthine dehydrogenase accessory factor
MGSNLDDAMPDAGFADDVKSVDVSDAKNDGLPCEVTHIARQWLDSFGAIAVATVVKTWGSSPVPVGGQLVVGPDDRFEGSVSGGCVEGAVITAAADVIATGTPRLLEFGIADETAWGVGLPCGGRIEIFVERLRGADDAAYLESVLRHRHERLLLVVETNLADGTRALRSETGAYTDEVSKQLAIGESLLVENEGQRTFLHALAPPVHVILVGAGHVGQFLSDLAQRIGFQVTMVDPRTAFSTSDRFRGVTLSHDWPGAALPALGLDSRTAVVALAHEARLDDETLVPALRSSSFYVGALGSRKTHEKRVERLRKAGLSDADIARIDAPVGLAIGAKGPAEIAVSILGAIIRARHGV